MGKRREEKQMCALLSCRKLSSRGFMYLQSWKAFVSKNFDEVLVSGPVPSLSLGQHPTADSSAIPENYSTTMPCIEDVRLTASVTLSCNICLN